MITSTASKQVKLIGQLLEKGKCRRNEGVFVAEGIKLFLETPPELIKKLYVSSEFLKSPSCPKEIYGYEYEEVADDIFKKFSAEKTPQGIVTLVSFPHFGEEEIFKEAATVLILNSIQDPGNLGTMVRCAEAAGVSAVLMDRGCADLFSPKVVRATMGSVYRVPVFIYEDLVGRLETLKKEGFRLLAAHLKGRDYFEGADYRGRVGIMIGNEGNGLSKEISALADELIRIPMEGKIESLNAAVSASLFMYEAKRQRDKF